MVGQDLVVYSDLVSPSDKEATEERIADRTEELARLQMQIEERERALPLHERIKAIFKKYGVTVTIISLLPGS